MTKFILILVVIVGCLLPSFSYSDNRLSISEEDLLIVPPSTQSGIVDLRTTYLRRDALDTLRQQERIMVYVSGEMTTNGKGSFEYIERAKLGEIVRSIVKSNDLHYGRGYPFIILVQSQRVISTVYWSAIEDQSEVVPGDCVFFVGFPQSKRPGLHDH